MINKNVTFKIADCFYLLIVIVNNFGELST